MAVTKPDHIELRDPDLGATARWDGGVTVVLVDGGDRVLARMAVGEAPRVDEIEDALMAILRLESERRQRSELRDRARRAIQRSWAAGGAGRLIVARSRDLVRQRLLRGRWTELEHGGGRRRSA